MSTTFEDKSIVITGSTQGVGEALAHAFLKEGARVVINGRSPSRADLVKAHFDYAGDSAIYVAADISSDAGASLLIDQAVAAFGGIDILINNAGMSSYGDLEDSQPKVIREVLDSNITGSLVVTHFALPHIRKSKGSILFISSLAALHGLGGHTIYSASKAATAALAQGLRKESKRHGYFVGYALLGFTENDAAKRTLAPNGSLEPVPSRPGIRPVPKGYAVSKILRQLRRRQYRSVHTVPGKLLFLVTRISERLAMVIMQQAYDAERRFLGALGRDK